MAQDDSTKDAWADVENPAISDGRGTEEPLANAQGGGWDSTVLDKSGSADAWGTDEPAADAQGGGWDSPVENKLAPNVQPWLEKNIYSPRRNEGLAFKPTSANNVQLGRARPLDNRKDLEDWKEIIGIARAARDVLFRSEPDTKLNGEDEDLILTQVLSHHPKGAAKFGCGIDHIKVAYADKPGDRQTKCFFLVRKDGTEDDFSYHKCLQTLASKKNPPLDDLYATAFLRGPKTPFKAPRDDTSPIEK